MQIALMPFVRAPRFNSSFKSAPSRPFLPRESQKARCSRVPRALRQLLLRRVNADRVADLQPPNDRLN